MSAWRNVKTPVTSYSDYSRGKYGLRGLIAKITQVEGSNPSALTLLPISDVENRRHIVWCAPVQLTHQPLAGFEGCEPSVSNQSGSWSSDQPDGQFN